MYLHHSLSRKRIARRRNPAVLHNALPFLCSCALLRHRRGYLAAPPGIYTGADDPCGCPMFRRWQIMFGLLCLTLSQKSYANYMPDSDLSGARTLVLLDAAASIGIP